MSAAQADAASRVDPCHRTWRPLAGRAVPMVGTRQRRGSSDRRPDRMLRVRAWGESPGRAAHARRVVFVDFVGRPPALDRVCRLGPPPLRDAVTWPFAAHAQQAAKLPTGSWIGVTAARSMPTSSGSRSMSFSPAVAAKGTYPIWVAAREEPPPAVGKYRLYFRLAMAVRSNLPVTTKLAPHQLEPNPPGLIAVKSPVNRAVWSLVKALQSPLLRSVS
jgi:hypothetical protein